MTSCPDARSRTKLSLLRQRTIDNLVQGQRGSVPVTVHTSARVRALLDTTRRINAQQSSIRITVTAVLAHMLARTIDSHPPMNSKIDGTDLVHAASVDLGLAVSLPTGELMLPVIRNAGRLPLLDMAVSCDDLSRRARERKLTSEDVGGAIAAFSSVGRRLPGVTGTPVLPKGATSVLLAAAPVQTPVAVGTQVVIEPVMHLSLTVDHRTVNGADILAFLQDLVGRIEGASDIESISGEDNIGR